MLINKKRTDYIYTIYDLDFLQKIGAINRRTARNMRKLLESNLDINKNKFQENMDIMEKRINEDGFSVHRKEGLKRK